MNMKRRIFLLGMAVLTFVGMSSQSMTSENPWSSVADLNQRGVRSYEKHDYPLASIEFLEALKAGERQKMPANLLRAQILHNLATAYFYQEKYIVAEPLFNQALTIREKSLGKDHLDTAQTLSNLAILHLFNHQYEKAESEFNRVYTVREKLLGQTHLETIRVLHDLGELYRKQGKLQKALQFHEQALAVRQKNPKPDADLGGSYHNMGQVYRDMGKPAKAAAYYKKALDVFRQCLPQGHLFTQAAAGHLYRVTEGKEGFLACDCIK